MRYRALVPFAALFAAACLGHSTLIQPGLLSAAPALSVLDAANGGNDHLYSLAPLAPEPDPEPSDQLGALLDPVVEIRASAKEGCADSPRARFTTLEEPWYETTWVMEDYPPIHGARPTPYRRATNTV